MLSILILTWRISRSISLRKSSMRLIFSSLIFCFWSSWLSISFCSYLFFLSRFACYSFSSMVNYYISVSSAIFYSTSLFLSSIWGVILAWSSFLSFSTQTVSKQHLQLTELLDEFFFIHVLDFKFLLEFNILVFQAMKLFSPAKTPLFVLRCIWIQNLLVIANPVGQNFVTFFEVAIDFVETSNKGFKFNVLLFELGWVLRQAIENWN